MALEIDAFNVYIWHTFAPSELSEGDIIETVTGYAVIHSGPIVVDGQEFEYKALVITGDDVGTMIPMRYPTGHDSVTTYAFASEPPVF